MARKTKTDKPSFTANTDFKGNDAQYDKLIWSIADGLNKELSRGQEPDGDHARLYVYGGVRNEDVMKALRWIRSEKTEAKTKKSAKPSFNANADFQGSDRDYNTRIWHIAKNLHEDLPNGTEPDADHARSYVRGGVRNADVMAALRWLRATNAPRL